MRAPIIQSTTNYNKFKCFDSNREVNKGHLKRLKESITTKNLLYLFPIVVNKNWFVVDGQHRLHAATELGLEVFYIIDNDVTQADIAMVNNNRKGWAAKDYIKFYKNEGHEAYERLDKLLTSYPLSIICAIRLMKAGTSLYWSGGGYDSRDMKTGNIGCDNYHTAKSVCEILKPLKEIVRYAYRPDFVLELKRLFVDNKLNPEETKQKLVNGAHLFPDESAYYDPAATRVLKLLLAPEHRGHSIEEVGRILKSQQIAMNKTA
jgi:hypothetical protein